MRNKPVEVLALCRLSEASFSRDHASCTTIEVAKPKRSDLEGKEKEKAATAMVVAEHALGECGRPWEDGRFNPRTVMFIVVSTVSTPSSRSNTAIIPTSSCIRPAHSSLATTVSTKYSRRHLFVTLRKCGGLVRSVGTREKR